MFTAMNFLADALPHSPQTSWGMDPGDAGWGDVIFVSIWAVASLVLGAYYCYKAFFTR